MRSEFEKNRYWIGLFKTDVEFNGLLGEFGRYEFNGSRDVNHSYLEDFNSKWEAYAKAWQHQQAKIDELQKRVDAALIKLDKRWNESWSNWKEKADIQEQGAANAFEEAYWLLEQALKGEHA